MLSMWYKGRHYIQTSFLWLGFLVGFFVCLVMVCVIFAIA